MKKPTWVPGRHAVRTAGLALFMDQHQAEEALQVALGAGILASRKDGFSLHPHEWIKRGSFTGWTEKSEALPLSLMDRSIEVRRIGLLRWVSEKT